MCHKDFRVWVSWKRSWPLQKKTGGGGKEKFQSFGLLYNLIPIEFGCNFLIHLTQPTLCRIRQT